MCSKNNHLNEIGKAGRGNSTVAFTPETYFRHLGLKPMSKKEIQKACHKLEKHGLIKTLQEAASQGDVNQLEQILSADLPLFKLIYSDYWPSILEKADLDARLPIRPQSCILDLGMEETMIMAFWKAACHDSQVTCLNNYHRVGNQWAQEVGEGRIKFADLTLPSLIDLSGTKFDALFLSPGWPAILGRDTNYIIIPKMQKANVPDDEIPENRCEDAQLLTFFELLNWSAPQNLIHMLS